MEGEEAFDKRIRARRLNHAIASSDKGKSTIYRLVRRYWQRGQIKNALLPDYKNSGAAGKRRNFSTSKAGRPRIYGIGSGEPVTENIRGKRIKWLILPLHESETDRHLIGLSG